LWWIATRPDKKKDKLLEEGGVNPSQVGSPLPSHDDGNFFDNYEVVEDTNKKTTQTAAAKKDEEEKKSTKTEKKKHHKKEHHLKKEDTTTVDEPSDNIVTNPPDNTSPATTTAGGDVVSPSSSDKVNSDANGDNNVNYVPASPEAPESFTSMQIVFASALCIGVGTALFFIYSKCKN
jgi:hypothetical protein